MSRFIAILLVLGLVFLLVNKCGRSEECQRVYDQYGSTVGATMEEGGYC